MQTFIQLATEKFIAATKPNEFPESLILLPSRRAVFFLEKELKKQLPATAWYPACMAIEDFIASLTERNTIQSTELILLFYDVYRNVVPVDKQEPLDRFVQWAPGMLADFNELDAYMVPSNKLFKEIANIRNLERWNVNGEEATTMQKSYLALWDVMAQLYQQLHERFEQKEIGYSGALYRYAANNFDKQWKESFISTKHVWWFGFNALNKCEEEIISKMTLKSNLKLVWDVDPYYLKNQEQEAGMFLRRNLKKWPNCNVLITSEGLEQPKNIAVYEGAGHDGVAQLAGQLVAQLPSLKEAEETALVPANEAGLLATIYGLPSNLEAFNITAGLGLHLSVFADWVTHFIKLASSSKTGKSFYHKPLWELLNHASTAYLITSRKKLLNLKEQHIKANKIYLSQKELKEDLANVLKEPALSLVTSYHTSLHDMVDAAVLMLNAMFEHLDNTDSQTSVFEQEQVLGVIQALKKMQLIMSESDASWTFGSVLLFIKQLLATETIQFIGEPLKGIQIMGMLESRVLDYKRVILTGVNEGVLPAGKSGRSFIPFDVKRAYGLPTHFEKDAIYAYHFYRLIQRAEEVFLVVDNETEGVKSAEESRFVKQLAFEWQNKSEGKVLTFKSDKIATVSRKGKAIALAKNEQILEQLDYILLNRGLSPSALNRYISSPLDFYFRYVLKLVDSEDVSETLEDRDTGNIIHEVLEEYLKPFVGKVLNQGLYKSLASTKNKILKAKLMQELKVKDVHGKNHLTLTVMQAYLAAFMKFEEQRFKKEITSLIGVEVGSSNSNSEFKRTLTVNGKPYILKGIADRIERTNNCVSIIDYKTGSVKPADLSITSIGELFEKPDKSKALQLLLYAWIYRPQLPDGMQLKSGIFSFPKSKSGFIFFKYNKSHEISDEVLDEFEKGLVQVIEELTNPGIPFEHNEDGKFPIFELTSPEPKSAIIE